MKKKLFILYSNNDKYHDHINKIIYDSKKKIIKTTLTEYNHDESICTYIVSNEVYRDLDNISPVIINSGYLLKNLNKKEIQENLLSKGYLVPKILLKNINTSTYIKSLTHEGCVKKIRIEEVSEIDFTKYYLEEEILGQETKYYFVNGRVFDDEKEIFTKGIVEILNDLSKDFNIVVYSIDIITNEKGHYIIDLNPCPGFYKSNIARGCLIDYMTNKCAN